MTPTSETDKSPTEARDRWELVWPVLQDICDECQLLLDQEGAGPDAKQLDSTSDRIGSAMSFSWLADDPRFVWLWKHYQIMHKPETDAAGDLNELCSYQLDAFFDAVRGYLTGIEQLDRRPGPPRRSRRQPEPYGMCFWSLVLGTGIVTATVMAHVKWDLGRTISGILILVGAVAIVFGKDLLNEWKAEEAKFRVDDEPWT